MNELVFYFKEGWQHIISVDAVDHQLFVLALVAVFQIKDWKKILVLVTAFTISHSITLFLSVYKIISISTAWVEFLIPCTIIVTSITNLYLFKNIQKHISFHYAIALSFGLIHGLGFANTIRFMLAKGQGLGTALLGFNVGLELGQLLVVTIILISSFILIKTFKLLQKYWVYLLTALTFTWAVNMALVRLP